MALLLAMSLPLIGLMGGCRSGGGPATAAVSRRGALALEVTPNPIIASRVSGDVYDFPFEAIIRETGGVEVQIERVTFDVKAFGGIPVYSEKFESDEMDRRGFPRRISANGELRYRFNPRKAVGDDRLFSAVSAELRVEGMDGTGARTTGRTTITIRR